MVAGVDAGSVEVDCGADRCHWGYVLTYLIWDVNRVVFGSQEGDGLWKWNGKSHICVLVGLVWRHFRGVARSYG